MNDYLYNNNYVLPTYKSINYEWYTQGTDQVSIIFLHGEEESIYQSINLSIYLI